MAKLETVLILPSGTTPLNKPDGISVSCRTWKILFRVNCPFWSCWCTRTVRTCSAGRAGTSSTSRTRCCSDGCPEWRGQSWPCSCRDRTRSCSIQDFYGQAQEPILRLSNLQLQRQRCSRLERFFKVEEHIFVFKTH
jgi:hypothetical protein